MSDVSRIIHSGSCRRGEAWQRVSEHVWCLWRLWPDEPMFRDVWHRHVHHRRGEQFQVERFQPHRKGERQQVNTDLVGC